MSVRDVMRDIDAALFVSPIVEALAVIGTQTIRGKFDDQPITVDFPGGGAQGVAISFTCQWEPAIGSLSLNDEIIVIDYGPFRFLRELIPGGDESGQTVLELGEYIGTDAANP